LKKGRLMAGPKVASGDDVRKCRRTKIGRGFQIGGAKKAGYKANPWGPPPPPPKKRVFRKIHGAVWGEGLDPESSAEQPFGVP